MARRGKQEFIVREMWVLAWSASVQRANLYKQQPANQNRKAKQFRKSLIAHIEDHIVPNYRAGCTEADHLKYIDQLITKARVLGKEVLGPDGYRYGVAQKLLNLALKYLWCLGHIKEPPHCPVDRILIERTSLKGQVNWTEIRTREEYKRVIAEVRRLASRARLTIARWELSNYSRR